MSDPSVLIAAFSGRALAQSARRAGFRPLVADAFGDADTEAAAEHVRVVPGAAQIGFRTKPLVAALESLVSAAPSPPIGLVLGSGFEDKTRLVAALAERFPLLGCSADVIRATKDPATFTQTSKRLGVAHPETSTTPPDSGGAWLSKRVGGSGGRHIRNYEAGASHRPRRYYQRQVEGERLSIGGVFSRGGSRVLATRQWISPCQRQPFRYGGACTALDLDADLFGRLVAAATSVAGAFGVVGMASFDFIVVDNRPLLVDVNARPGAALDVLDDADGYAFASHVASCQGAVPPPPRRRDRTIRAAAILHADKGPLTVGAVAWPDWSADRPPAGARVAEGEPLATAFAEADSSATAQRIVRARLAELETLIYTPRN